MGACISFIQPPPIMGGISLIGTANACWRHQAQRFGIDGEGRRGRFNCKRALKCQGPEVAGCIPRPVELQRTYASGNDAVTSCDSQTSTHSTHSNPQQRHKRTPAKRQIYPLAHFSVHVPDLAQVNPHVRTTFSLRVCLMRHVLYTHRICSENIGLT